MKKDLDYYLNLPYKIELKKIPQSEGGGWGAFMPEFNGVAFFYGDGESKNEALDELDVAFRCDDPRTDKRGKARARKRKFA